MIDVVSTAAMFAVIKRTCKVNHELSDEYISTWTTKVIEVVDDEYDAKDRMRRLHLQHVIDDKYARYSVSPFMYMDVSNVVDVIEGTNRIYSLNNKCLKRMQSEDMDGMSQESRELLVTATRVLEERARQYKAKMWETYNSKKKR